MPNFNQAEADRRHRMLLNRVEKVRMLLVNDILDYYDNDFPDDEEEETEIREDIRKYLKYAYQEMDEILDDLDRELGY